MGDAPRDEPADWLAGGKKVLLDRVEWVTMPDPGTAAGALQSGEIDWWENPIADLVPVLKGVRGLNVGIADPLGNIGAMRINHLQPPFDDVRVRHALQMAVDQEDYMRALVGDDDKLWRPMPGFFTPGTPLYTEAGGEMLKMRNIEAARKLLAASSYDGRPVTCIVAQDQPITKAQGDVTADLLQRIGFKLDFVATDWGTVVQRRTSREPVEKGGWNIFHTTWKSTSIANPALNTNIRGQGAKGWFGWFDSPEIERLTREWLDAQDEAEQQRLLDAIQAMAFEQAPVVPLGQFLQKTAFRADLRGILPGPAAFPWNVRRG